MTERRAPYKAGSSLEETFAFQLRAYGLDNRFRREAVIIPGRRYRFDFACDELHIAIEINGGTWSRMGHSTGTGIERDYEKLNEAQLQGWMVLLFTGDMVKDGRAIEYTRRAIQFAG